MGGYGRGVSDWNGLGMCACVEVASMLPGTGLRIYDTLGCRLRPDLTSKHILVVSRWFNGLPSFGSGIVKG